MLVIGEKEVESGTVSVRKHREGDIGTMSIEEFITYFKKSEEESKNPGKAYATS